MRIRDEKKEQLVIDKAVELLVSDGFEGFSMNKLARACSISVATLYIYYKDKDDLIKRIGREIAANFFEMVLRDFRVDMSFSEGLRKQWLNRMDFAMKFPTQAAALEILKHSPHGQYVMDTSFTNFKMIMSGFYNECVRKKELLPLSIECYWSIAFGPLYSLLRFHAEGKSLAGKPFVLTKEVMEETLEISIKALTP